jgi:hypothetical protein
MPTKPTLAPVPFGPDGDPVTPEGRHLVVARVLLEDALRQLEHAQRLVGYDDSELDRLLDRAALHATLAYEEITQVEERW